MGLEKEDPVAFLTSAKQAVQDYQQVISDLNSQREAESRRGRALDQKRRETQDKIERTLKSRQEEIDATYERQLTQVDNKLKRVQAKREKARNLGIQERIAAETEPLIQSNQALRKSLSDLVKDAKAPGFLRSDLFYTLFRPGGLKEILILICFFLFFFALLPVCVFYMIPDSDRQSWQLIIIYVLDILIFGGLYVYVSTLANGRFYEISKQGREIKNTTRSNVKKINDLKKRIQKDVNDSGYHLEEYDDEIARTRQEREEILQQKQNAQATFENVTRNIIKDEIEAAAKPQMDELAAAFNEAVNTRLELENKEKEGALSLSRDYEQFLGKRHMNEEDIDGIMAMVETGEASSIIDAVSKLEHPDDK